MKITKLLVFAMAVLLLPALALAAPGGSYGKTIKLFRESPEVQRYFDTAYGYAVFPLVGKGGAGVGGAFGKGRVYREGKVTGRVTLAQLSIGLQMGGQAYSEIIFFQDQRAYNEFTSGSFELGASASAVAITAGAQALAGSTGASAGASLGPNKDRQFQGHYVKGLAIFVHAKGGLMYEAVVAGQKFIFEKR